MIFKDILHVYSSNKTFTEYSFLYIHMYWGNYNQLKTMNFAFSH